MLSPDELNTFESVAKNHPKFRAWVEKELSAQIEILVQNHDVDKLKRAQGHASCLKAIIGHLDKGRAR